MINLLARYKISCSLRGGPPLPAFWRSVVDRSPELRAFEAHARGLDRQLAEEARASAPSPPRDLHSAILEAVRQADRTRPRRDRPRSAALGLPRFRWAFAIGTAVLVALAFWWAWPPDQAMDPRPLAGEVPGPVTAATLFLPTPAALFAEVQLLQTGFDFNSLDRQWEAIAEDVQAAVQFLKASLP
jgi:hypothetical protein